MDLSQILSQAAIHFPHQTFVIDPTSSTNYADFYLKTRFLAAFFQENHISTNSLLAICLPKNTQSLAALLAVLEAQAAYVPLDAHGATQRNISILEDCKPQAVILSGQWGEVFSNNLSCKQKMVSIPNTDLKLLLCEWEEQVELVDDLAFILYTSGSTGTPKGVLITHQNALAFIQWANETFEINPGDVCTSIAPFHFDLSVFDIYVSMSNGATLFLIGQKSAKNPRLVAQWFEQYQVHTCYATPSFLKLLLRHGRLSKYAFSKLKHVLFAGEVFDIESLKALKKAWPGADFYNLYGPTETNVVTYFPIPKRISSNQKQLFPIGKACSSSTVKLWNGKFLVPPESGIEGELAIAGPSVSPGYLGLHDKKLTHFVKDESGNKYYLTGDWVRVGERKNLVFKGRKDRRVKRRGYRIELAELERALAAHPIIHEVACIFNEKEIIAFCAIDQQQISPNFIDLNQFLMTYLPAYMLPDRYQHVDELPHTSTQKIDYQNLTYLIR